jgi:hypothetical protein
VSLIVIVTKVAFRCRMYIPGLKERSRYPLVTFLSQGTDSREQYGS